VALSEDAGNTGALVALSEDAGNTGALVALSEDAGNTGAASTTEASGERMGGVPGDDECDEMRMAGSDCRRGENAFQRDSGDDAPDEVVRGPGSSAVAGAGAGPTCRAVSRRILSHSAKPVSPAGAKASHSKARRVPLSPPSGAVSPVGGCVSPLPAVQTSLRLRRDRGVACGENSVSHDGPEASKPEKLW
jgi:hypothetical protein